VGFALLKYLFGAQQREKYTLLCLYAPSRTYRRLTKGTHVNTTRCVFITWVGDDAHYSKKSRASAYKGDVIKLFSVCSRFLSTSLTSA
jgi:hypothetical protein